MLCELVYYFFKYYFYSYNFDFYFYINIEYATVVEKILASQLVEKY